MAVARTTKRERQLTLEIAQLSELVERQRIELSEIYTPPRTIELPETERLRQEIQQKDFELRRQLETLSNVTRARDAAYGQLEQLRKIYDEMDPTALQSMLVQANDKLTSLAMVREAADRLREYLDAAITAVADHPVQFANLESQASNLVSSIHCLKRERDMAKTETRNLTNRIRAFLSAFSDLGLEEEEPEL